MTGCIKSTYAQALDREKFILENYDSERVNTKPKTAEELLTVYAEQFDPLYGYVRELLEDPMYTLNNEIRALLGHLADYSASVGDAVCKNLEKADGHFRRMNIDAFKILCDQLDARFVKIQKHQYAYDFRSDSYQYLLKYSDLYFKAKAAYINAQTKERVGSDRGHNVISLYHDAAKLYISLKQFYCEQKKMIRKVKRFANIKKAVCLVLCLLDIIVTIVPHLL